MNLLAPRKQNLSNEQGQDTVLCGTGSLRLTPQYGQKLTRGLIKGKAIALLIWRSGVLHFAHLTRQVSTAQAAKTIIPMKGTIEAPINGI